MKVRTALVNQDPPRTVKLIATLGTSGFHYGADVVLPEKTARIRLSIGPTFVRVLPGVSGRFSRMAIVGFAWKGQAQSRDDGGGHQSETHDHPGGHKDH